MSNLLLNTAATVNNLSVYRLLTKNYGLGKKSTEMLCKSTGICSNFNAADLAPEQVEELTKKLSYSKIKINEDLKKELMKKFEISLQIKSYKSLRKVKGYPANGQRTRSNAKTARKKKIF